MQLLCIIGVQLTLNLNMIIDINGFMRLNINYVPNKKTQTALSSLFTFRINLCCDFIFESIFHI